MQSLAFDSIKILVTALIIFAVAQLSQRDTLLAALLASIPLVLFGGFLEESSQKLLKSMKENLRDGHEKKSKSLLIYRSSPSICLWYTNNFNVTGKNTSCFLNFIS